MKKDSTNKYFNRAIDEQFDLQRSNGAKKKKQLQVIR